MADKAGQGYWDSGYRSHRSRPARRFDPTSRAIRRYWQRRFHEFFERSLSGLAARPAKLLEVGCGGSALLPYFSRQFGFAVAGIDYSTAGCEIAARILREEEVQGEIVCADLFEPPAAHLGRFDVVVSFGVVEHFTDPARCIRACSRFLAPGGVMITTVPNMAGIVGRIQSVLDRRVFTKHVALDAELLSAAHARAGLRVMDSGYLLFANFGVVNINEVRGPARFAKSAALQSLRGLTALIWAYETRAGALPPNRFSSPYAFVVARSTELGA